jgi:hypothetical protein
MLKTFRAGVLAFAALCLAPIAAHAACPTAPTYTTLSGLDAASATKTLQMLNGGSGFLATPLLQGWTGSAAVALTSDANCNLQVNVVAGTITANVGTTGGLALNSTLGSPFQAGGSIGNTSFGISGTLPAFAATPTFNIGTAPTIGVTGTFFQPTQPVSVAAGAVVDGGDVAEGTTSQAACAGDTTSGCSVEQRLQRIAVDLAQVHADMIAATPAGNFLIGKVGTDQTTHGTTDLVAADITKVGGAALALGQAVKAASIPVTLASDQPAVPVSLTDSRPGSTTISAADAATTTIAGMGSVTLVTGTPTANSFQTQAITGMSSGTITVPTGSFVATMNIEGSPDGGTTYTPLKGNVRGSDLLVSQITQAAIVGVDVTGLTNVRVRASAYTSGTPTVQMTFSPAPGMTKLTSGVKLVDSGGGDATDATNHAIKATSQGLAASGASDTDIPLNDGCRAATAGPTAVTDGQKVAAQCSVEGKKVVLIGAIPEKLVSGVTAAMTGTTSTLLLAAPAAGLRNYVTNISCGNSHASVGTFVTVQDGSGGTAISNLTAASVFGGEDRGLPTPLRQPTTATGLYVADVTTGANVICVATGYVAP